MIGSISERLAELTRRHERDLADQEARRRAEEHRLQEEQTRRERLFEQRSQLIPMWRYISALSDMLGERLDRLTSVRQDRMSNIEHLPELLPELVPSWGVAAGRFAASGAVLSARAPKLPAAAQAPAASQAPATQAPGFRRHPADRLWDRFACLRDRVAEWGADLGRAPVVCPPDGRGLHTVAHGPVAASLPTRAFTIGLRCGTFGSPNYMFDADRRAAFAARRGPVGPPRVRFRLAWCG